jgi:hypothetical protein
MSLEGIRPGRVKTKAISNYPKPTNVHEVRQFTGLTSYFRRFIRNFAAIAKPLTVLAITVQLVGSRRPAMTLPRYILRL